MSRRWGGRLGARQADHPSTLHLPPTAPLLLCKWPSAARKLEQPALVIVPVTGRLIPDPACAAALQRHRPHQVWQGRPQVPRRRILHQLHARQGARGPRRLARTVRRPSALDCESQRPAWGQLMLASCWLDVLRCQPCCCLTPPSLCVPRPQGQDACWAVRSPIRYFLSSYGKLDDPSELGMMNE